MSLDAQRTGDQPLPVIFHGAAKDYFPIWLKNSIYSILTLGLYRAWALARDRRYFWGATSIDGVGFERFDEGSTLFAGMFKAWFVIGVLWVIMNIFVTLFGSMFASKGIDAPGIIVTLLVVFGFAFAAVYILGGMYHDGLIYRSRVTLWRGLHFDFSGEAKRTRIDMILKPGLIWLLSFGFLAPVAARMFVNHQVSGVTWGSAQTRTAPNWGPVWRGWFISIMIFFLFNTPIIMIVAGVVWVLYEEGVLEGDAIVVLIYMSAVPATVLASIASLAASAAFRAGLRNGVWNGARLGDLSILQCRYSPFRAGWIAGTNQIASIASLGFARPWAKVRMWRYWTSGLTVIKTGDFAAEAATTLSQRSSATGDAALDAGFGV